MASKPLALICGDGGIYGGFIAGFLSEMNAYYSLQNFKVIAATSASVGGMLHYFSYKDEHRASHFWIDLLATPEVITPRPVHSILYGKPLVSVSKLMECFQASRIVEEDKIDSSPQEFIVPLLNARSNQVEYWDRERISTVSSLAFIHAAKAAPVLIDGVVPLQEDVYLDPGPREPFVMHHPHLENTKRLIVLSSKSHGFIPTLLHMAVGMYALFQALIRVRRLRPRMYWDIFCQPFTYRRHVREALKSEALGDAMVIFPEKAAWGFDYRNPKVSLARIFEGGRSCARQRKAEILAFLES